VGAAEACLEMSVEYAKGREQFGRPIGSFQSIKHRLTDMLVALELAHAAVLDAANADERPTDELATAASIAHVLASEAFTYAAEESIQIHGGIGFTWEHPLHRYFRRAKSDTLLFGSTETHHEVIAASVI
jgi:alkylation response protein AidB-like acyl-CoA dehydrogenase